MGVDAVFTLLNVRLEIRITQIEIFQILYRSFKLFKHCRILLGQWYRIGLVVCPVMDFDLLHGITQLFQSKVMSINLEHIPIIDFHNLILSLQEKTGLNEEYIDLPLEPVPIRIEIHTHKNILACGIGSFIYGFMHRLTLNLRLGVVHTLTQRPMHLVEVDGSWTEDKIIQIGNRDVRFHGG